MSVQEIHNKHLFLGLVNDVLTWSGKKKKKKPEQEKAELVKPYQNPCK